MLVIPGQYGKDTCDGFSRRELLRIGGSAVFGFSLPAILRATSAKAATADASRLRRPGLRQGEIGHPALPAGGPEPSRLVGPEDERPRQRQKRLQQHQHEVARRPVHREPAQAGKGQRQDHAHPLDELHADRPVQPHGRHLPDADRLHGRQREPFRPARAAQPQGLPELRVQHRQDAAARGSHAALRDDAPAVAGEQRDRQGGDGRLLGSGLRSRITSIRPATIST